MYEMMTGKQAPICKASCQLPVPHAPGQEKILRRKLPVRKLAACFLPPLKQLLQGNCFSGGIDCTGRQNWQCPNAFWPGTHFVGIQISNVNPECKSGRIPLQTESPDTNYPKELTMNKDGPIVIVEDDDDERFLLELVFNRLPYANERIYFTDGEKALEFLNRTEVLPFLILPISICPGWTGLPCGRNSIRTRNCNSSAFPICSSPRP